MEGWRGCFVEGNIPASGTAVAVVAACGLAKLAGFCLDSYSRPSDSRDSRDSCLVGWKTMNGPFDFLAVTV